MLCDGRTLNIDEFPTLYDIIGDSFGDDGGGQAHNNMQPTLYIGNMFIFAGTRSHAVDPIPLVG